MSLLVRRAVPEDAPAACRVVRDSITELCVADHRGDASTIAGWLANKTQDNLASWISSLRHVALVAEEGGAISGFALLNKDGTIALLYVSPGRRFVGVSKALLEAMEDQASALRIPELRLKATATALPFYVKRGYLRDGDPVPGFGISHGYPLRKRLHTNRSR